MNPILDTQTNNPYDDRMDELNQMARHAVISPSWVQPIHRAITDLHEMGMKRADAVVLMTYCIQMILAERTEWVGD